MKAWTALFAVFGLFVVATSVWAFAPLTGNWWNPNESGSGYNIEINKGTLVVTIYSYKTNGDSEWYLAAGPMSSDQRHFTGTLDKYRNGQCISCTYSGLPAQAGNDGTISIDFVSETSAILTLPGGRSTRIEPFFPSLGATRLDGTYRLTRGTIDFLGGPLLDTEAGDFTASGTMVMAGNRVTQSVTVTMGGSSGSISVSGTFTDYGTYIVAVEDSGGSSRAALIVRRGPVLVTEGISDALDAAPPFAEVEQWTLVAPGTISPLDNGLAVEKGARIEQHGSAAPLGRGIGTALMAMRPR